MDKETKEWIVDAVKILAEKIAKEINETEIAILYLLSDKGLINEKDLKSWEQRRERVERSASLVREINNIFNDKK
jgi:hypothetical protein